MPETPKVDWDRAEEMSGDVVWFSKLDGRFLVEVRRGADPYKGVLRIFDHESEDRLVAEEDTGISYGAPFGADIQDVHDWSARAIEIVDGLEEAETDGGRS